MMSFHQHFFIKNPMFLAINRLYSSILLLSLGTFSVDVLAGGFSLYTEGSASAVGNYAAGIAAEGRDASVGWYNPAAMVLLQKPEIVLGAVGVMPVASLSGTAGFYQREPGYDELLPPYIQSFSNIDGAREAIVPNLHLVLPVGERLRYGLSIISPLGLSTNWGEDSPLRYAGTFSKLQVINVSPEMGGLINDHLAIGWGLDLQWASVDFDNVLGIPAGAQLTDQKPSEFDSPLKNHGKAFGAGFHAGVLLKLNADRTRFGFNYEYGVTQSFKGSSSLSGVLADDLLQNKDAYASTNELYTNDIRFPDILTFSLYQQVNDKVALMGSIVYSIWSPFNTIVLNNVVAYSAENGQVDLQSASAIQNYQNALRASFGMNYQLTEQWQFRWGGGYDQTPTNNTDRDIRLPDVDKFAIAVGAHWQSTQHLGFDIGYSYLLPVDNTVINKRQDLDSNNWVEVNATGHSYAQLFAAQLNWRG